MAVLLLLFLQMSIFMCQYTADMTHRWPVTFRTCVMEVKDRSFPIIDGPYGQSKITKLDSGILVPLTMQTSRYWISSIFGGLVSEEDVLGLDIEVNNEFLLARSGLRISVENLRSTCQRIEKMP